MGDFVTQIKILARSVIIKRDKLADVFEVNLDQRKAADRYINTIDNGDKWESYVRFDYDVIVAAGVDKTIAQFYAADKEKIPRELRPKIVALQKQYVIDNYQELNDYYLMLHGEPPIEDTEKDWIYCPVNSYGIPSDVPVHKLDIQYISLMESIGIIDQLKEKYPTKTYLDYLGRRSIDYYTARSADNFALLFAETAGVESVIREDFITFYDRARSYYLMGFYNRDYSNMFVWYDEFIGLLILTMAIQRLISNIYKQGLTRDFYDVNLIKYLFKSYSIPYIEDLEMRYQRALAKNLNHLLQYKSTDNVLYDVSYMLGFYDINIYKYYLVKTHVLDEDGVPLFPKKTYKENGKTITVPDYEKMYRFHFQQVNLKEPDVNSALLDKRNRHEYEDIISEDPYWVDDADLKNKLYETDYNHLITKYMSLDVLIKMVEMVYEMTHIIRLVIDDQEDFKKTMVNIPIVSLYDVSLFDIVMFMCALIANKMGLPGNVPIKGYQIANVYGFNYNQNIDALVHAIYDTKDLVAGEVLYAEDTMAFYEVIPNGTVTIPNYFQNTVNGGNTDAKITLANPVFRALQVERVTQLPEDPVENAYYNIISDDRDMYCYSYGTHFTWDKVTSVPKNYTTKEVTELPKFGEPAICYIVTPSDTILYRYINGEYEDVEYTSVHTLAFNLIDNGLATYIKNLRAVSAKDLGVMYKDLKTLRTFIVKMMEETDNIDVYQQYVKLYKSLLVTEDVQELYRDNNGNVQKTFADLLQANNPDLYNTYLRDIDSIKDLNSDVNAILSKMASFGEFKYLANINRADTMFDTVLQLIRFFKSYTVDFVNSGIKYILDDKYFQGIKILDACKITSTGIDINTDLYNYGRYYKDLIQHIRPHIELSDDDKLIDKYAIDAMLEISDKFIHKLEDNVVLTTELIQPEDISLHYDTITDMEKEITAQSKIVTSERNFINVTYDGLTDTDNIPLHDKISVSIIDE